MTCNDIKCPYYKKAEKRDYCEKMLGITQKAGGCKFSWCKLKSGSRRKHSV